MRIVLTGTEKKLVKPSGKDLALPDWDGSYLEWVDLSGLKVPPLRDADCFHYKATGTIFQNTDYTQFRYPIDLADVTLPLDTSSYNHDFTVEVMRRAANADHPGVQLIADHVAASYRHSWSDSLYRVIHELKMTPGDVREMFSVAFEGYPRLLSRLAWHLDNHSYRAGPPNTEFTRLQVGKDIVDLAPYVSFGLDRAAMRTMLRQVASEALTREVDFYVVQSIPHFTILIDRWPV